MKLTKNYLQNEILNSLMNFRQKIFQRLQFIFLKGKKNREQLGKSTIEVNLSDTYSKSEVNALVSVKNDKITIAEDSSTALTDADTFSTTSDTETNPTNLTKRPLSLLWNYIKTKILNEITLEDLKYSNS